MNASVSDNEAPGCTWNHWLVPDPNPEDDGRGLPPVILAVRDLTVRHPSGSGEKPLLQGIDFEIAAGETVGLSGPSGVGKTLTALALLGLGPDGGPATPEGSIRLNGRELVGLDPKAWAALRGREIGLVPQDPGASLTPVRRVGDLLSEVADGQAGRADRASIEDLLREVGFDDPGVIARRFPHELSGGMQQRVAIAAALAGEPELLIADEPTSSLDVIASHQIMELLGSIQNRRLMAMLLISHDRRVLAHRADRSLELRAGRISPDFTEDERPRDQPVSVALGRKSGEGEGPTEPPMLELTDLRMEFGGRGRASHPVPAVRGVSLTVRSGELVGLVGPTGSGKSTLARCATRLLEPTGGEVSIKGEPVTHLSRRRVRGPLAPVSLVFQNPASSLNPRRRVEGAIEAPLRARGLRSAAERRELVLAAAGSVRLDRNLLGRLPAELSGGQQQRVALARALVTNPELLILDEPFTALDHELEDELIGLLDELRTERGLAMLLITHDMRLVARITDRVAVMSQGRIVELGDTDRLIADPSEPITAQLIEAAFGR